MDASLPTDRIVLVDTVVTALRSEGGLASIQPFDEVVTYCERLISGRQKNKVHNVQEDEGSHWARLRSQTFRQLNALVAATPLYRRPLITLDEHMHGTCCSIVTDTGQILC